MLIVVFCVFVVVVVIVVVFFVFCFLNNFNSLVELLSNINTGYIVIHQ